MIRSIAVALLPGAHSHHPHQPWLLACGSSRIMVHDASKITRRLRAIYNYRRDAAGAARIMTRQGLSTGPEARARTNGPTAQAHVPHTDYSSLYKG